MAVINSNLLSLTARQHQGRANSELGTTLERLSSGLKVNSAADDAAGQAIGNRMAAQEAGQHQAARNANDGISMIQTAEGALDEVNDRLQRIRELSVQGLNGTITADDADAIQAEINQNLKEIDRLNEQTEFNGMSLLNGDAGAVDLQVGADDGQELSVDLGSPGFSVDELGLEDFTIYGLEGEITPRKTLQGSAHDIVLKPDTDAEVSTDLSMYVNGEKQDNNTTDYVSGSGGLSGSYIKTEKGGNFQYYSDPDEAATHYTKTNNNEVTIESNTPIFSEIDTVEVPNTSQQAFELSDGTTISSGNDPVLVSSDEKYYIQTQENNLRTYREASVTLEDSGSTSQLTASAKETTSYTTTEFEDISGSDNITVNEGGTNKNTAYDDYSSVEFTDTSDTAFPNGSQSLVEHDGSYFIKQEDSGTTTYYKAELSSSDSTTLSVQATESTGVRKEGFTAPTQVNDISVDSSSVDFSSMGLASGDARLLKYQEGNDGYYVEDTSGADPTYTKAQVSLTASDTSASTASAALETGATPEAFSTIDKINGNSVITLDESNVEVNYTARDEDGNPRTYNDVLRQDEDGRYYMRLSDDVDSDESFVKGTLVDNLKSANTLVQTSEGSSEVLVYFDFDFSASTDADLIQADTGDKRTVVNINADDDEIRIKQPNDPLATLDEAIERVDDKRGMLGAMHNRLDSVIDGLSTAEMNTAAARSRIMDADYADESSKLMKQQVIQQASQSMLAQANQVPQTVLSLLPS
ncbi:flagellin [Chromohalobacter sp. 48-RD10]|uniref:flagellin N-terminal helical domain-containing protein n=1 Tax=Chromohalobacter sp. 48-RD10 TaxID=2994063 RepID=UPI0024697AF5|nr:flagellin [Chromohalobacter sp. 48-RD10]